MHRRASAKSLFCVFCRGLTEIAFILLQPQLVGDWESLLQYPIDVGEAQGGIMGTDLVVTGGFLSGWNATTATYALDVSTRYSSWRRMDDFPLDQGMTHAAFSIHEKVMYFCGGYMGRHPGPAVSDCFLYNHAAAKGEQWQRLPSLPEPRAGGGLVYNEKYGVLVFAGGTIRSNVGTADAIDSHDTWMLATGGLEYGWVPQSDVPYLGNHLSYVTTSNVGGSLRHYFMGGQEGEEEKLGNLNTVVEYVPLSDEWFTRANMPQARGHASSSTVALGCGFLIAGGAIDGTAYSKAQTADISYYNPNLDSWNSIGELRAPRKTPVCGIYDNYLYCSTGYTKDTDRRQISLM